MLTLGAVLCVVVSGDLGAVTCGDGVLDAGNANNYWVDVVFGTAP